MIATVAVSVQSFVRDMQSNWNRMPKDSMSLLSMILCVIIVDCIGKLSMKQWMCKNG